MNFRGIEIIRDLINKVRITAPIKPQNSSEHFLNAAAHAPSPEELPPDDGIGSIFCNIDVAHPTTRVQTAIVLSLAAKRTINIRDINDIDSWTTL